MAEGVFREAMKRHGMDCLVDSAGTAAYHIGSPPDPRAIATAQSYGIDIANQTARQIEHQDFYRFSHIIAMDKANIEGIKARRPRNATAEINLLLNWLDGDHGHSVPDPYHGGDAEFQAARQLIAKGANAAAHALVKAAIATQRND